MQPRALGILAIVIVLACSPVTRAQTAPQAPGAAVPGPAAQRPQTTAAPPRDSGAAPIPTGTGRIRGRVVAADTGNPLRRAQVRMSGNQPGLGQMATTDADGRYEFLRLPAATYNLMVFRSGYLSLEYGQQRAFERGKPLTLADGESAEKIDFALPRGGVIVGKVTDESGEPLPGVRMQAQRYQYTPGGQRRLTMGNMTMGGGQYITDDLGQFRVYGLMPGSYVLSAIPPMTGMMMDMPSPNAAAPVASTANEGYAVTYFPGTSNVEEAQTISVATGQESAAFFPVVSTRMSRISGFVRNSQGGRVTGRLLIALRNSSGTSGYTNNIANMGSPDGTFTLANVPPGDHILEVRPMPGPPPPPGTTAQATDEEFASIPISVSGQDISGLIVTTGPGATITGRLSFEGNSPRPRTPQPLRVSISPADMSNPSQMIMMTNNGNNGIVDEGGKFQIRGVNGQVLFRIGAQGWILKSVTLDGVDITDMPFDAKPSTTVTDLEITLTDRLTSLSGVVKNSRGEIVKDSVVVIFPAQLRDGMISTRFTRNLRPDQDGKYQIKGLPPGDYVAAAIESLEQGGEWDPAFQQQMRERGKSFRLGEAQTTTLDLALSQ